jgi:hypothetical protein
MRRRAVDINALFFDDFYCNALFNDGRFPFARRFVDLIAALRIGKTCIVADITYCKPAHRGEPEYCLRELVPGVRIQWWFFANDPETCRHNVRGRARAQSMENELREIDKMGPGYTIPPLAEVIPVVKAGSNQQPPVEPVV